ncbi:unnamed protein product [Leuciscus chuanchicus]
MSAGRTVEGAGCVTWWGFGPARDLLNSENTVRSDGELNVLLVGSGDPRHILKTITGLTDSDTLHVWVIENNMARTPILAFIQFKERDELVRIFKLWERPPSVPASVRKVWDARVRQHLGTRYDSRQGCFDWDLSMKLHQRGRGDRVAVRGYWGDIVSGPYLSFGIETENKDLLKKQNNQHVKTARDISEVNVLALFECLATRESSLLNEDVPNPSSSCCQSADSLTTEEKIQNDPPSSQTHTEPEQQTQVLDLLSLNGVKVSFLSPDSLNKLPLKNKYRNLFNSIFCSASMVHQLDSSLREIAAPDAALVIELANFLLDLSKEQVSGFADRVKEIAEESGFTATHDQISDSHSFRYTLYKHTLHYISHIHLM